MSTEPEEATGCLFELTNEELALVRSNFSKLDLDAVINRFYELITSHSSTTPFFDKIDVELLKSKQKEHLSKVIKNGGDADFVAETKVIGAVHEKIGVTPEIYLFGYSKILQDVIESGVSALSFSERKKRGQLIGAYTKLIMMDISASLTAYLDQSSKSTSSEAGSELAQKIIDDSVNISMSVNHVFIDTLKTVRIATDVNHQVNSISSAIEEMATTVGTITQNTEQAREVTQMTAQSSEHGIKVSEEAMQNMEQIQKSVDETSERSQSLSESSKKIEAIIAKIQDIADQTNLLALNATIEAARAGDAGKGFAVVANEVKALSNETTSATQEISDIINEFISSIQGIVAATEDVGRAVETGQNISRQVKESMSEIGSNSTQMRMLMDEIPKALEEHSLASTEIANASVSIVKNSSNNKEMSIKNADLGREASETISNLINSVAEMGGGSKSIVKLAKSDHIIWKRKLADLLFGKDSLKESELSDHTQCRLGKWYYSIGKEKFSDSKAYKDLEEPHKRIHELGREIFTLYKNNDNDKAVELLGEVETLSEVVVNTLDELDKMV